MTFRTINIALGLALALLVMLIAIRISRAQEPISEVRFAVSGLDTTQMPVDVDTVRIRIAAADDSVVVDRKFPVPDPGPDGSRQITGNFSAAIGVGEYRLNMTALAGTKESMFSNTVPFTVSPVDGEPAGSGEPEAPVIRCFSLRLAELLVVSEVPCE